jgi:hypothetical protein
MISHPSDRRAVQMPTLIRGTNLSSSTHTEWANRTGRAIVRKVFISYARQNKPGVEQLVENLRILEHSAATAHHFSSRG